MSETPHALRNVRNYCKDTQTFRDEFSEALEEEQGALPADIAVRLVGKWVICSDMQATWRTVAATQVGHHKMLPASRTRLVRRPLEVIYIKSKGKVIVDGPEDLQDIVVNSVLSKFTQPDDEDFGRSSAD